MPTLTWRFLVIYSIIIFKFRLYGGGGSSPVSHSVPEVTVAFEFELDPLEREWGDDTRAKLIEFCERRQEFYLQRMQLDRMRIEALRDPAPDKQEAIAAFTRTTVIPLNRQLRMLAYELQNIAIDRQKLGDTLPAVVSALLHAVDLRLLLIVHGIDDEEAGLVIERIRRFLKEGLPDDLFGF